jgi:hypothetical protein
MFYLIGFIFKNSTVLSGKLQRIKGCAGVNWGILPYGGENCPGPSRGCIGRLPGGPDNRPSGSQTEIIPSFVFEDGLALL